MDKMIFYIYIFVTFLSSLTTAVSNDTMRILFPDSFKVTRFSISTQQLSAKTNSTIPNQPMLDASFNSLNKAISSLASVCENPAREKRGVAAWLGLASQSDVKNAADRIKILSASEDLLSKQIQNMREIATAIVQKGRADNELIGDQLIRISAELHILMQTNKNREHEILVTELSRLIAHGQSEHAALGGSVTTSLVLNSYSCSQGAVHLEAQRFFYRPRTVIVRSHTEYEFQGAYSRLPALGEKISPFAIFYNDPLACPPSVFYNPLSMASKATDDEHRHVGGPVKDGCWYLSFDRIPGIDEHAVHFDISHDVEEPLERYIPQPLAAAVLQPPAAPPQQPSNNIDNFTLYSLVIASTIMAAVTLIEMTARYIVQCKRYKCIHSDNLELQELEQ